MKETNCDEILMALMAVADGEETRIAPEQAGKHISGCESCRIEVKKSIEMARMLQNYTRGEEKADLWPEISGRIGSVDKPDAWANWQVFAGLAIALAAYKLIEMLPANNPGHLLKIAPFLAAAVLFMFLRENPFKINTELIPER